MSSHTDDIVVWRQAHFRLTLAIAQSRDNIAEELTKRRYLLEEIHRCKAAPSSQQGGSGVSAFKRKAHSNAVSSAKQLLTANNSVAAATASKSKQKLWDAAKKPPHKKSQAVKANTAKAATKPKTAAALPAPSANEPTLLGSNVQWNTAETDESSQNSQATALANLMGEENVQNILQQTASETAMALMEHQEESKIRD